MSSPDPITAVTATLICLPLPRELQLGPFTVSERTYAVVGIRTASGLSGSAYQQTRGAPIVEIIDNLLTPALLGKDSASIEARWRDCFRSTMGIGRTGMLLRALSLVDIALWDIQAKRADLPLHRLLGGVRDRVPTMLVAGYPNSLDDIAEVVEAAQRAAAEGHQLIKIARAGDVGVTAAALSAVAEHLPAGVQIVIDASWTWEQPMQALAELMQWPDAPIAWLEDPLPPEQPDLYRALRERSPMPIGAGDEVTDRFALQRLVDTDAVDVLRLDVATIGGITTALRVIHHAEVHGVPLSTHISPEVSAHLAAAFPAISAIETFDRSGNRIDPSHELVRGGPTFTGGFAVLGEQPGIGWELPA